MTPEETTIHRRLRDMPDARVPPMLEARILQARRSRLRRNGSILAGACLACAAAALAPLLLHAPEPSTLASSQVAVAATEGRDDIDLRILAIDQALQAAYDSNAHSDEIASLWRARASLLATDRAQPSASQREPRT